MADRRYNTQQWKRLRRLIIHRAGGICQVRGPRCTRIATTAHHILPSSQYPDQFWDPTNLQASCGPCNHHGANVKHANRVNRQEIAYLESVIDELTAERDALTARVDQLENGAPEPTAPICPRVPRIY